MKSSINSIYQPFSKPKRKNLKKKVLVIELTILSSKVESMKLLHYKIIIRLCHNTKELLFKL